MARAHDGGKAPLRDATDDVETDHHAGVVLRLIQWVGAPTALGERRRIP
jgi:hypothetical protein